jgi:hypothetical protein
LKNSIQHSIQRLTNSIQHSITSRAPTRLSLFLPTDEVGIAFVEGEISDNSRVKYSDSIEDAEMMFHSTVDPSFHLMLVKPQPMDYFLLHPKFDEEDRYPMDYHTIREYQTKDQTLVDAVATQDHETAQGGHKPCEPQ